MRTLENRLARAFRRQHKASRRLAKWNSRVEKLSIEAAIARAATEAQDSPFPDPAPKEANCLNVSGVGLAELLDEPEYEGLCGRIAPIFGFTECDAMRNLRHGSSDTKLILALNLAISESDCCRAAKNKTRQREHHAALEKFGRSIEDFKRCCSDTSQLKAIHKACAIPASRSKPTVPSIATRRQEMPIHQFWTATLKLSDILNLPIPFVRGVEKGKIDCLRTRAALHLVNRACLESNRGLRKIGERSSTVVKMAEIIAALQPFIETQHLYRLPEWQEISL